MNNLLLDTNIVSYLMRNDALARLYRPHLANHSLAISFMTLAELYEGAFRGNWGAEKRRYLDEIQNLFVVIPSDRKLCSRWGEVRSMRSRQPISAEDAWIAATAIEYNCPLVTHNSRDFRGIPGLTIITESA
ncbi:MAG: type II toxin-antitoxin system VapC family toxin [Terriglobia bacterium]